VAVACIYEYLSFLIMVFMTDQVRKSKLWSELERISSETAERDQLEVADRLIESLQSAPVINEFIMMNIRARGLPGLDCVAPASNSELSDSIE